MMHDLMQCNRCGKCCEHSGIPNLFCSYLKRNKDGTTFCTVYNSRLGRLVFPSFITLEPNGVRKWDAVYCGLRSENNRSIKGCSVIQPDTNNDSTEPDLKTK